MRAGKLRRTLTIQEASEARDSTGSVVTTWATFATVHGSVEPLRGREFWSAKELQAQVDTRIRIRYLEGVTPKMQIVDNGTTYLIYAVLDIEKRHIQMDLMCQEMVAV